MNKTPPKECTTQVRESFLQKSKQFIQSLSTSNQYLIFPIMMWSHNKQVVKRTFQTQNIIQQVLKENKLPEGIFNLIIGRGSTIGEKILSRHF